MNSTLVQAWKILDYCNTKERKQLKVNSLKIHHIHRLPKNTSPFKNYLD